MRRWKPNRDPHDCEVCKEAAENNHVEYQPNFTWDEKKGEWVCDGCGDCQ